MSNTRPDTAAATCVGCPHTHAPAEAAAMLGMPEETLRIKAGRREYPSTKVGRNLRFSDADIAQIIAASSRPAATVRRRARRSVA